uniref:Uncharacterized protein n=1 Tax=Oryza glumipatula TaxID=40148 RepID=A0A0E0ALV2_9ORYZ
MPTTAEDQKQWKVVEVQRINAESHPPPRRDDRCDDLRNDEEFQRVMDDVVFGRGYDPTRDDLRISTDPTAMVELIEYYHKMGLIEGEWVAYSFLEGVDGVELEDKTAMDEKPVKEEDDPLVEKKFFLPVGNPLYFRFCNQE